MKRLKSFGLAWHAATGLLVHEMVRVVIRLWHEYADRTRHLKNVHNTESIPSERKKEIIALRAPNRRVERSLCCWIAVQRLAPKECFVADTSIRRSMHELAGAACFWISDLDTFRQVSVLRSIMLSPIFDQALILEGWNSST